MDKFGAAGPKQVWCGGPAAFSVRPGGDGDPDGRVIDGADGALSRQHEGADEPADLETRTVATRAMAMPPPRRFEWKEAQIGRSS